jgi:hypothetical protein
VYLEIVAQKKFAYVAVTVLKWDAVCTTESN